MPLKDQLPAGGIRDLGQENALLVPPRPHHPIAGILPMLDKRQLDELTADIIEHGQRQPVIDYEDMILDGRGIDEACRRANVIARYKTFVGSHNDAVAFVISQNLARRHLSDEQRAMIAARLVDTRLGSNQHSRDGGKEPMSVGRASSILNVSARTVGRYLPIARNAPDVADAVVRARITFPTAKKIAQLPPAERDRVLSLDGSQQLLDREATTKLKLYRLSKPVVMPEGCFDVVVADPPWPIKPEPAYPTMSLGEIKDYLENILATKSADHCFLFLWATEATRKFAFQMVEDLGWKIKELFIWHKSRGRCHPGRPSQNAEFVILAEKGRPEFIDTIGLRTCFSGEVGGHSEKPIEFFEMVKQATAGPRLELFARRPHDGFEPHGNEIDWSTPTGSQPALTVRAATDLNRFRISSIELAHFEKWIGEQYAEIRDYKGMAPA